MIVEGPPCSPHKFSSAPGFGLSPMYLSSLCMSLTLLRRTLFFQFPSFLPPVLLPQRYRQGLPTEEDLGHMLRLFTSVLTLSSREMFGPRQSLRNFFCAYGILRTAVTLLGEFCLPHISLFLPLLFVDFSPPKVPRRVVLFSPYFSSGTLDDFRFFTVSGPLCVEKTGLRPSFNMLLTRPSAFFSLGRFPPPLEIRNCRDPRLHPSDSPAALPSKSPVGISSVVLPPFFPPLLFLP